MERSERRFWSADGEEVRRAMRRLDQRSQNNNSREHTDIEERDVCDVCLHFRALLYAQRALGEILLTMVPLLC